MNVQTPLAYAVGAVIAAASVPSLAQSDAGIETQTIADAAAAVPQLEEIIVTGSRIRRDGFTSSSPIDVIYVKRAGRNGISDLGGLLRTTSIASGSSQVTSASSTAFVTDGGQGAETISLRGLGASRTLTLINGRRAGPAGVAGSVSSFDLNVIPMEAVERIEILKEGASSVYGSDAVAGVINIITDKGDGSSFSMFSGQPTKSGGEASAVSLSLATSVNRFRSRITGSYTKESQLKKGQRDYFSCPEQYVFDPTTGERADQIDPRTGKPHCNDALWGHVWIYDYSDELQSGAKGQYDYDGDLGSYLPGFTGDMVTPDGWYPVDYDDASDGLVNADHPFQDRSSLIPKNEVATIFAEATYDLSDHHQAYGEILLNRRETASQGYRQFWTYLYNSDSDGEFTANESATAVGWTGNQTYSPLAITDQDESSVTVDYRRVVGGLKGDINSNWQYDISYQYSYSDATYTDLRLHKDAVDGNEYDSANGDGTCAGTLLQSGVPCQDLPWLDPAFLSGDFTSAEISYLFGEEMGATEYTQQSIEGFVTGPLFELPAGEVAAAFGVHYRTDEIEDTPGAITLSENAWGSSGAGITKGDDTAKAIFAEVDIPLLEGLPLVNRLTMNLSARYNEIASYGSGDTYKVGLDWAITDTLRLRGGRSTSFRAPALFELYLADQTSFVGQRSIDPCINWGDNLASGEISQRIADNCQADGVAIDQNATTSATVITGGGLGRLQAETSRSNNIGVIWRPEFADLRVSIDFFDILIEDEVDVLGGDNIVYECYNSSNFSTEPLCNLFERDANLGFVDNIQDSYINIAEQRNRGWDLAIEYGTPTPWGQLSLETQHTFQIEDSTELFEDTIEDYNGEIGDPKWTGTATAKLEQGDWTYQWNMQFVGKADNYGSHGSDTAFIRDREVRVVLDVPKMIYHNLSVERLFQDSALTLTLGVSNAFGEEPPTVTTLNLGELDTEGRVAFYSQYDWLGRAVHLTVEKSF